MRAQAIRINARRAIGLLEAARKTISRAREESRFAPRSDWLRDSARMHATAAAELAAAIAFIQELL